MAGRQRVSMFTAYILYNKEINKYYIGSTNNLVRRLIEHNRHQTKSTNRRGKWEIIYSEDFDTNIKSRQRELKIKSYKGGNSFKKLIAGVVYR